MKIVRAKDYEEMSTKAAAIIMAQVISKPDCVLGLATGSSPIGLYKRLIEWNRAGLVDFSQVRTWNLDEYRGLPRDNERSYYYFMHEHLFNHINIPAEAVHVINGLNDDAEEECAAYDAAIEAAGGLDLQLLGLGHDGHIAFNEPREDFPAGTHCVDLNPITIEANARFFASADDVPKQAYTMGIGSIMKARRLLVIISGADKAEALKKVMEGPVTPWFPGSILQFHPDVTIVATADALGE